MIDPKNLLLFAIGILILTWSLTAKRAVYGLFVIFVIAVAVYPEQLSASTDGPYTGIAQSSPVVTTYIIAAVLLFGIMFVRRQLTVDWVFIPFFSYAAVALLFNWDWNSYTQAGILQLVLGAMAWTLGTSFGRISERDLAFRSLLMWSVGSIVFLQICVAILQLGGIDPFPLSEEIAALMGTRVHGTLNHPNNLGKVLVLLACLVMPMLDDSSRRIRVWSTTIVAAAGLGVMLTQGRANVIAFAVLVVIRIIGLKGIGASARRIGIFLFLALAALPFIPTVAERFADDPDGGSRPHLTEVALAQFAQNPLWGIGPNEYVHVVGQSDLMTSHGLPVHNSYLLALVELGVLGATLWFLPFFVSIIRSIKAQNSSGFIARRAASALALGLGFVVIAATGWGALSGYVLPLWMFALGYLTPTRNWQSESPDAFDRMDRSTMARKGSENR